MRGPVRMVVPARRQADALLLVVVLAAALSPSLVRADIIFHVPEVLVRHAAVPRPVGTGRPNASLAAADSGPDEVVQQRFEYFVEHAISTTDAKKIAMTLKPSDIPHESPGCGKCTKRDMEYCETKLMADHCCCDRRYMPEPFPWLPHTCYIGPERCTPLAKNCVLYNRIRDCCCMHKLAEHWKSILSKSPSISTSGVSLLVVSAIVFTIYF